MVDVDVVARVVGTLDSEHWLHSTGQLFLSCAPISALVHSGNTASAHIALSTQPSSSTLSVGEGVDIDVVVDVDVLVAVVVDVVVDVLVEECVEVDVLLLVLVLVELAVVVVVEVVVEVVVLVLVLVLVSEVDVVAESAASTHCLQSSAHCFFMSGPTMKLSHSCASS